MDEDGDEDVWIEGSKAIDLIAVKGCEAFKDGISISDLSILIDLAKEFETLKNAIVGIDNLDEELKDSDGAEISELFSIVMDMIKKVKEILVPVVDITTDPAV